MAPRFQHQSSASSIKFARSQPHPSPASATRSSRFARPSPTQQQPLSTPGISTSRFRDPPSSKDEIETSFDEPDHSSPRLPSRSRFSSSVSQYRDVAVVVDDLDDENEDDDLDTHKPAPRSRPNLSEEVQDDELADLEFLERLRGTRQSQHSRQAEIDTSSGDETFATPLAARKRRRLENRTDHAFNAIDDDYQLDLSPQQPTSNKENHNNQPAAIPSDLDSESDLSSTPLASPTNHHPSTTSSRFKLKAARPQTSTSTSLAQMNPPANTTGHRPLFRPNAKPNPSTSPSHPVNLPPAFSPSRRRGGRGRPPRDYFSGGAADTVRNLILGLGVTESQRQGHGGGGDREVERVTVAGVLRGSVGGRYVMFRDEVGRGWVLIGLGSSDEFGVKGARRGRAVSKGCVVRVRMGWEVDVNLKGVDMQGEEDEEICSY